MIYIKKQILESAISFAKENTNEVFLTLGGFFIENNIIVDELYYILQKTTKTSVTFNYRSTKKKHIGTIHSHPGIPRPSNADLNVFSKEGMVHGIIGSKRTIEDIVFYNKNGEIRNDIIVIEEKKLEKILENKKIGENKKEKYMKFYFVFIYATIFCIILLSIIYILSHILN